MQNTNNDHGLSSGRAAPETGRTGGERKLMMAHKSQLMTGAAILLALSTGALSGAAQAQDSESEEMVQDTIVVTATKRAEAITDVPMSVSALTGEDLAMRGADELGDYFRTIPGVQYQDYGATGRRGVRNVTIRGINGTGDGGPLVGYYIDETPTVVSDPTLFDIERVEVLRGPQGTLYGQGTAGGLIKIVTNKPNSQAFSAKADLGLSTTEKGGSSYTAKGMVNIPLAKDKAAVRIIGYYEDLGGYVDSVEAPSQFASLFAIPEDIVAQGHADNSALGVEKDLNDSEIWGARAALELTPIDGLMIRPSVQIHRAEMGGEANFIPEYGDLAIIRETKTPQQSDFDLYNLTMSYDFESVQLLSSTSYYKNRYEGVEDNSYLTRLFVLESLYAPDPSPYELRTDIDTVTQEVRLQSLEDGPLQWTVGAFYNKTTYDDFSLLNGTNLEPIISYYPLMTAPSIGDLLLLDSEVNNETRELAAFAEGTYDLTDQWRLTVGFRYFDAEVETVSSTFGALGSGPGDVLKATDDGLRPKISLSYKPTDNSMVYALASQGFRTGGASTPVPSIPACDDALAALGYSSAPDSFGADSIWNYEGGVKSTFAGGRVQISASGFFVDWSNIAQAVRLADGNPSCAFTMIVNAGDATSKGFEFEANAEPVDDLYLGLAVGYTDAELGDNPAAGDPNERILQVPDWTVSASGEYNFALTRELDAFVRGDYQYVGDRKYGFGDTDTLPSYDLFNARFGVQSKDWRISFFIENLTDERAYLAERDFGTPYRRYTTLRPRTYGINLSKDF